MLYYWDVVVDLPSGLQRHESAVFVLGVVQSVLGGETSDCVRLEEGRLQSDLEL